MDNYGYLRVKAISPRIKLADPIDNGKYISMFSENAAVAGAGLVLFPELVLTGCSCGDIFFSESLRQKTMKALETLLEDTAKLSCAIIIGLPLMIEGRLANCAAVLQSGKIKGIVPKTGNVNAAENRWFAPVDTETVRSVRLFGEDVPVGDFVFRDPEGFSFGIEIGSDGDLPYHPATALSLSGAQLIVSPSARPASAGGMMRLASRLSEESRRCCCAMLYAGAGPSESTSDFVYGGECLAVENGEYIAATASLERMGSGVCTDLDLGSIESLRQKMPVQQCDRCPVIELEPMGSKILKLARKYSKTPFLEEDGADYCREILEIQATGLAERLKRAYSKKAVIGVSGGSDSTLAILVAARAVRMLGMSPDSVLAVTMPGFGTTDRTKGNAYGLMESLGCELREISIAANAKAHLIDIGHDLNEHNVTYENAQARERTQVLMDIANDVGGMVVGTGDMSETALGWCTYGGDHLSMYSVNGGLTKGMVKAVIASVSEGIKSGNGLFADLEQASRLAEALDDVLDTPVSPELLPPTESGEIAQITEDKVGPYELHDFYLWHMVFLGKDRQKVLWLAKQVFEGSYDNETIEKWLDTFCRRFVSQQFKRDCAPGGPQVADNSFSPRGGWVMPSDASGDFWK